MKTWYETILQQLGGNMFVAMTGAKQFSYKEKPTKTMYFKIGRNCKGVNYVGITLNEGLDLYNMEFLKVGKERKVLKSYIGIYFDQLRPLFTESTGMYTSL